MKKLFAALVLFATCTSFSHTGKQPLVNNEFDPPKNLSFGLEGKYGNLNLAGVKDGKIFTFGEDKVRTFNTDLNMVNEVSFSKTPTYKTIKKGASMINIENMVVLNDKVVLFFSYRSKGDAHKLAYLYYDVNTGKLTETSGKPIVISTNCYNPFREWGTYNYGIHFSQDKSKFAVVQSRDRKKKEPFKFEVTLFNNNMEKLSEYQAIIPVVGNEIFFLDPVLGNNGDFYFLTKEVDKGGTAKKRDDKERHNVYRLNAELSTAERISLDQEGIKIVSNKIFQGKNNEQHCVSYFEKGGEKGIALLNLEKGGDKKNLFFNKNKVKAHFTPEGAFPPFSLEDHTIKQIIPTSDEGILLISEQHKTIKRVKRANDGSETTTYTHHRDSIYVTKITQQNEIEWTSIIDKEQRLQNDAEMFLSFFHCADDQSLYIFFNGYRKSYTEDGAFIQKKRPEEINVKLHKYAADLLIRAKIDLSTGTVEQKAIWNNRTEKFASVPEKFFYDEEASTLYFANMRSFGGLRNRLGKITF